MLQQLHQVIKSALGCYHPQHSLLDSAAGIAMGGGTTGTLRPLSIARIFSYAFVLLGVVSLAGIGFVDCGAADGRMVICGAAVGAAFSFGIEVAAGKLVFDRRGKMTLSEGGGVELFFTYARKRAVQLFGLTQYVDVVYGVNAALAAHLSPAQYLAVPYIAYAFIDGWTEPDMHGLFIRVGQDRHIQLFITSFIGASIADFAEHVVAILNQHGAVFEYRGYVTGQMKGKKGSSKTMLFFLQSVTPA